MRKDLTKLSGIRKYCSRALWSFLEKVEKVLAMKYLVAWYAVAGL
jgi:hypothetical protein